MSNMLVQLVADPYPPYQFSEGGMIRGVDHDVVAAAFAEHGLRSETRLLSWDECLRRVVEGEADGIFQIQRSPERDKTYLFSQSIRTARTVFFKRAGFRFAFGPGQDPVETLAGLRLGVVAGYGYGDPVDAVPDEAKIAVESQEELLAGLVDDRFDLIAGDLGVISFLSRKLGIADIERVEGAEIARVLHVAFNKERGDLVTLFDSAFEQIIREGLRDKIFRQYGVVE